MIVGQSDGVKQQDIKKPQQVHTKALLSTLLF